MEIAVKDKNSFIEAPGAEAFNLADWLPPEIGEITDHQTDLPRIAKDPRPGFPRFPRRTICITMIRGRLISCRPNSAHLVVTLKEVYNAITFADGIRKNSDTIRKAA